MFKTITMSIAKAYDKTAKIYNDRYRETQFEKYRIMLSGLKLNGKILDHGCGTGLLSAFLKREDLIGCDNSAEMLKIRGSGDLCDVEKLPYKDAEFDVVLSFSVLMNCKNPKKAVAELKRVLKPKSVFVCTFLKSFESKLKPLLAKNFKIQLETTCGEDIGLILKPKHF
jgi:ubiquinone/menaquinone biosynthesis C-methylase UbiE